MSADSTSIQYPSFVYYELDNLRATNYGRFLPADADLELYAWPLLWTNSYTGKFKSFY